MKKTLKEEFQFLLLQSDIKFSCIILGIGLVFWGLLAAFINHQDLIDYANSFPFYMPTLWVLNSVIVGLLLIYYSLNKTSPIYNLLLGSYMTCMWTWIAVARTYAPLTSGVTLNLVVILMGIFLVHRSGRH